jgi:hypothetical protein
MKKLVIMAATLVLVVLAGCGGAKGTGTLEGTVTIGPLTPVQSENVTPTTPCSVYEARKIVVFSANGQQKLHDVDIDCEGHYRIQLAAGTYTVDINHSGIDRAAGFPKQVTITADQTTTLDVDIDTGIR